MVAVAVESTSSRVIAISNTDENPHEDNGGPSSKAVVAFKDAVREKKREMVHAKLGMPK